MKMVVVITYNGVEGRSSGDLVMVMRGMVLVVMRVLVVVQGESEDNLMFDGDDDGGGDIL